MAQYTVKTIGEKITLGLLLTKNAEGLTGLHPTLEIRRNSDGRYLDFSATEAPFWKTSGGVREKQLTERTWMPGLYTWNFDQALYDGLKAEYTIIYRNDFPYSVYEMEIVGFNNESYASLEKAIRDMLGELEKICCGGGMQPDCTHTVEVPGVSCFVPFESPDSHPPVPAVPAVNESQVEAIAGVAGQPFFEIYVKNNVLGGSLIHWGLKRTFFDPGPYHYKLQWAETPNGEWQEVETEPLVDTYFAVDPNARMHAVEMESYYRLVLTTSKGTYVSMAAQSNGVWDKRDWLIARDICRKELLYAKKYTGMAVDLVKRRIWGPRCPVCADWDSKEVAKSMCYTCWGTGIVGGYWPGYSTWMVDPKGQLTRNKAIDDQAGKGIDENIEMLVRVLGYPHLSTYDLLKDHRSTGRIFVVRDVSEEVNVRGIPIIYMAKIKMLPFSHFLYQWPNVPPAPPEPPYAPVLTPADDWMF